MSLSNKKMLATGAVMVGLSAFVPNPFTVGDALAQMTAQETLNMSADIVNPLAVTQVTGLNWGKFGINGGGVYDIQPGGTQTILPAAGFVIAAGTPGAVHISVPKQATFTLSIPKFGGSADILMARTSKATTTATANFKLTVSKVYVLGTGELSIGGGAMSGTLSSGAANAKLTNIKLKNSSTDNEATFNWGGRMTFGAFPGQTVGQYDGTFTFLTTL